MSGSIHDKVDAFADGELPAGEAEEFRAHLVDCAACQAELREIMMVAAVTQPLASASAATSAASSAVIDLAARRRRRALIATVSALTAAAAMVILWRATRPEPIVLAQADKRPLEARLSDASADRFRPYDVERAAGTAREEVRVDTLARLQERGDWRRLADAYLLGGEPLRAGETLARAGESADVESDRAALALQLRDPATALAHATRALQLAPGYAQATWNRALALRELGLLRAAAQAFEAIAARGERGWSDEARTRAASLRAAAARQLPDAPPSPAAQQASQSVALELGAATGALGRGDAARAQKLALAGLAHAQAAALDPRDLARRFFLVLAEAARAQGQAALADAYVDEARLLVPDR